MDRRKTELNVQPTKISGRLHFMCLQMSIMPKRQATEIGLLPFRVSYVIYNYLKIGGSLIFSQIRRVLITALLLRMGLRII